MTEEIVESLIMYGKILKVQKMFCYGYRKMPKSRIDMVAPTKGVIKMSEKNSKLGSATSQKSGELRKLRDKKNGQCLVSDVALAGERLLTQKGAGLQAVVFLSAGVAS